VTDSRPLVELSAVSKDYGGLRPLRIAALAVADAERVAITGVDAPMAETFVNLVTGAVLPDRGEVRLFGRATGEIIDSADWLAVVDRFGIVSERAVLLEPLSVVQNLSMPFTLEIEPPAADVREQAQALAREVGLPESSWDRPVAELGDAGRVQLRLGRALALGPAVVILEHINAALPRDEWSAIGRDIRATLAARGTAAIVLTADRRFAAAVAERVLSLDAATGRLNARRWF
jgi:ABC-type polar amino acid transport system ATPase subunit